MPPHPLSHLVCLPSGGVQWRCQLVQPEDSDWPSIFMHWRCTVNLARKHTLLFCRNGQFWYCPDCVHHCVWVYTIWSEGVDILPLRCHGASLHNPALLIWSPLLLHLCLWLVTVPYGLEGFGKVQLKRGNPLEENLCCLWSDIICGFRLCHCI